MTVYHAPKRLVENPGRKNVGHPAHPAEYIFKAGEVGALFVPVAQEAEGFKLSLELHVAAVELVKALEGR